MEMLHIRVLDLKDSAGSLGDREYWERQSIEARLSAVEELRLQFGKLPPGVGYDGSQRFEEFFASFNAFGVEYLVVGGYAFALHAHPRYTGDMDVFVRVSEENARRVMEALLDFGFTVSSLSWKDFTISGRVVQLGHPPLRIDIMTAIDGVPFDGAWTRRINSLYGSQQVPFISKADLIANKRATGRKQDLLDLESLE